MTHGQAPKAGLRRCAAMQGNRPGPEVMAFLSFSLRSVVLKSLLSGPIYLAIK